MVEKMDWNLRQSRSFVACTKQNKIHKSTHHIDQFQKNISIKIIID